MTSNKYISIGKTTSLISFIIGMLIFGTYYFTTNAELLFLGYGFIILAGIINLIILIGIRIKAKSDKDNRKKLLKTSRLMLLNIPILFLCIWISMIVLGNMRITFTNGTENKLKDIKIVGCETEYITELEPNESKTVWIGITGDCSITVEYTENGKLKTETVAGYVTSGMGQKMKHKIDGKDKDILRKKASYLQRLKKKNFTFQLDKVKCLENLASKLVEKLLSVSFRMKWHFKLTGEPHSEALSLDGSQLFDPSGKKKAMKEWVQAPFDYSENWAEYAKSAMEYVSGK